MEVAGSKELYVPKLVNGKNVSLVKKQTNKQNNSVKVYFTASYV